MPSRAEILANVEDSAYYVAASALVADKIVKSITPEDLPAEHEHDVLLTALMLAMQQSLLSQVIDHAGRYASALGYQELSADDASTVADMAVQKALTAAIPRLDAALVAAEDRIQSMSDSGVNPDTIHALIETDEGLAGILAGVRAVLRQTASGIVTGIENATLEASQAGAEIAAGQSLIWDWVTMGDGNVCEDVFENSCAPRHGQFATLDEWAGYGMPKAPNLLCSIFGKAGISNCRCLLIQTGTFEDINLGALDASSAIAAGKARAGVGA